MLRLVLFSLLWALVFGAAAFVISMAAYAALGFCGVDAWRPSMVALAGRVIAAFVLLMPGLGFTLGLLGRLPGTSGRGRNAVRRP